MQAMQNDASEEQLVAASLTGDGDAFGELTRRCFPPSMRVAQSILGSREDAEDALQNAVSKAYQNLPQFRCEASFRTWFTSILVNECRAFLRQARRARFTSIDAAVGGDEGVTWQLPDPKPTPEERLEKADAERWVRVELNRLPPILRHVVRLADFDEVTMQQAAAQLGISVAAAKARLHRGRNEMRARIERRFAPARIGVVQ